MAASGSGNNGNGNGNGGVQEYYQLKLVATAATAQPDGKFGHNMHSQVFTLPKLPMLDEDTAEPIIQKMLACFPFDVPMHPRMAYKCVHATHRLLVAVAATTLPRAAGKAMRKGKPLFSEDGLAITTLKIDVVEDVVQTVIGEFEGESTDSETDSDDDDDDGDFNDDDGAFDGGDAMEE